MNKEEWDQWRHEPATKQFFRGLNSWREEFKEQWARGLYLSDNPQQTQNNAQKIMGMMEALETITELTFDDFITWSKHENQNR